MHMMAPQTHPSQPDQTGPATWTTNLSNGEVHSSDARARMLGYEPSEAQPRIDWWDALLHPDDIQAVRAARARHYKGVDAGYRSEYRARRRDGSWAWLLEVGSVSVRTSGGAP
ncbi:MAG: PAS domain-containing protein, partial [Steroidobacterales bacterium]